MHEDDWRWHFYDTVKGSDWLGDQVICSDKIQVKWKILKESPDMMVTKEYCKNRVGLNCSPLLLKSLKKSGTTYCYV